MKLEDLDKIPTLQVKPKQEEIKSEKPVIKEPVKIEPIENKQVNNKEERIVKYVEVANMIKDSLTESKINKETATFLIRDLESIEKTLKIMTEKNAEETNQVNNFLIILKDKMKDRKKQSVIDAVMETTF
jgi:hypothetical protein